MTLKDDISGYDIFISKVDKVNESFPFSLALRVFSDRDILKNGPLVNESDTVVAICNKEGNIPHRDITFFLREEEIINIYGFYLNFTSECFSLKALEKIFKEIKKTFGKDIYIPKDSVYLKEKIDKAPEKEQKLFSILDNITGIKKISEIGWVY